MNGSLPVSSHSISHSASVGVPLPLELASVIERGSATALPVFPPFFRALVALLPTNFRFSIRVMVVSNDRRVGFTKCYQNYQSLMLFIYMRRTLTHKQSDESFRLWSISGWERDVVSWEVSWGWDGVLSEC